MTSYSCILKVRIILHGVLRARAAYMWAPMLQFYERTCFGRMGAHAEYIWAPVLWSYGRPCSGLVGVGVRGCQDAWALQCSFDFP